MHIVLYRPEIPQNTGNIGRLCFCTNSKLHIVGEPSFSMDESAVRRAGLDYWRQLDLTLHADWAAFLEYAAAQNLRIFLYTRFARNVYSDVSYAMNDALVFGRETDGLPEEVRASIEAKHPERVLRIPVGAECRSLNLANTAALVLYEALRQQGYPGLERGFE